MLQSRKPHFRHLKRQRHRVSLKGREHPSRVIPHERWNIGLCKREPMRIVGVARCHFGSVDYQAHEEEMLVVDWLLEV